MHMNIRSICAHFDELIVILNQLHFKFDVIVLTETHLQLEESFNIPDYTTHSLLSKNTYSDWVTIFVNNDRIEDVSISTLNNITTANAANLEFSYNNEKYSVLAFYIDHHLQT